MVEPSPNPPFGPAGGIPAELRVTPEVVSLGLDEPEETGQADRPVSEQTHAPEGITEERLLQDLAFAQGQLAEYGGALAEIEHLNVKLKTENERLRAENNQLRSEVKKEQKEKRELTKQLWLDKKTGLGNSDALEVAIIHQKNNARRRNMVVVFLDANNFGQINKNYGQIRGDEAIREIGRAIQTTLSEFNIMPRDAFRAGGDEFAVFMPEEKAEEFARRVRENFGMWVGYQRGGDGEPTTAFRRLNADEAIPHTANSYVVSISGAHARTFEEASTVVQEIKRQHKEEQTAVMNDVKAPDGATKS